MGFHLVKDYRSWNGERDFAKVYYLDDGGNVVDETNYPYSLYAWKSYSEEELTLEIIRDSLLIDEGTTFCIMPNVGKTPFQRTDGRKKLYKGHHPLLEDQARSWIQFDIDWGYELRKGLHDMPHEIELRNLAQYVLRELGLPPDIGYVAQRSSSAKIKKGELRIRLYVLLDKALNSAELYEAFSAYDEHLHPEGRGIDLSMVEKNRIHLVNDPIIADERIEVLKTKGPDVYLQNGPRLKIDSLKSPVKGKRRRTNQREILSDGEKSDKAALSVAFNILKTQFKAEDLIPWKNQDALFNAIEEHTKNYPSEWEKGIRRNMIWWLIRYDQQKNGDADKALDLIMNNPVIFGPKWKEAKVKGIEEHQRDYLLAKWGCGDIQDAFEKEEMKIIHSRDMSELTDEELDSIPKENCILFVSSACGTGKTKLAQKIYERIKPSSSASICYSKAAQLKNAKDFNQTYYLDAGNEMIPVLLKSEDEKDRQIANKALHDDYQRKFHFMKWEEHIASTAQSGRFIRDGYPFFLIDETEHCLETLFFKPNGEGTTDLASRHSQSMIQLLETASNSNFVMLADAKASDDLTGWFIDQIQGYPAKKKFLLLNTFDWVQTMNLYQLESKAHCLQKIVELVEEGKRVAIQVDFANGEHGAKPEMDRWRKAICEATGLIEDKEVISRISSDFVDEEERQAAKKGIPTLRTNPNAVIENWLDEGLKVLLCSPWNQVAFSYEGTPFDATVNIYTGSHTHAEDMEQGFRRWRRTEEHYFGLFCPPSYFGKNDIKPAIQEKISKNLIPNDAELLARMDAEQFEVYYKRRENPKAHFKLHMDAKGKPLHKLKPNKGWTKYKKILSEAGKDADIEAMKALRETRNAIKSFYIYGESVLERVEIEEFSEISEDDLRKTAQFKRNHCEALCERFLMDDFEVKWHEKNHPSKYYELQYRLWNSALDVIRPYIGERFNHIFDWLISPRKELSFHYDNTQESKSLKAFVSLNAGILKSVFQPNNLNRRWTESPNFLFEHIAQLLYLDYEKIDKDKNLKIADIHKELAKEYGIPYRNRSNQAKIEILARYRERKRTDKALTKLERKYELALGPRYVFKKRKFCPEILVNYLELFRERNPVEPAEEEKNSRQNSIL